MSKASPALMWMLLAACSQPTPLTEAPVFASTAYALIVPGERVGRFVIGRDSLASILGSDTKEARNAFAEQGLVFLFEQGKELRGITVIGDGFVTAEGFRVGSSAGDVEGAYGPPLRRVMREVHGRFEWQVLAYPGITFFLQDEHVSGIGVFPK